MRSFEENITEVFASLVHDGIICFADHGLWLNMQGSVNHYLHHSKFNWNYGSRWKIGTCSLISSPIRVYLLGWVKKATIHACNTTCRYLMPFFAPARCGIIWWGQTTLGVRAAARGRIMQSSRWENRMGGGDDRGHIMKDNGDSGAIMNVICMWQCDNCDIW